MNFSEQDTRVKIIDEKLKLALWNEENIIREYYFNAGKTHRRQKGAKKIR